MFWLLDFVDPTLSFGPTTPPQLRFGHRLAQTAAGPHPKGIAGEVGLLVRSGPAQGIVHHGGMHGEEEGALWNQHVILGEKAEIFWILKMVTLR